MRRLYTTCERVTALRLYFAGSSIRKVSRRTSVPKSTIHDWVKRIVQNCRRCKKRIRKPRCSLGQSNDIIRFVLNKLQVNPFASLFQLKHELNNELHTQLSISTIQRLIRKAGWSYQKVSWRVPSRDVQNDVEIFFETFNDFVMKGYQIVSLDETGFVSTKYQQKGYGIRGKRLRVSKRCEKRQKVTSIVAITSSGLMVHHSTYGNANGKAFLDFLDELLPMLDTNTVIILDNIAFHKSASVKDKADSFGVKLLFISTLQSRMQPNRKLLLRM